MATNNSAHILFGNVNVFTGAAGVEPVTATGYTSEEGITVSVTADILDILANETLDVVKKVIRQQSVSFQFSFLQYTLENMAKVFPGASLDGATLTLASAIQNLSVKLVGTNEAGITRTVKALYVNPSDSVEFANSIRNVTQLPVTLQTYGDISTNFSIVDGNGNIIQELATGVLTRIANEGYHKVGGEGDTSDSLDSITGAGLTDGETLRLQCEDATNQPITLVHLDNTLELLPAANWVMNHADSYIDLVYVAADTAWKQIERFDATDVT